MAAGVLVFPSVKQVRVRTCAEQEEHELLTVHAIDQKPIGTDVAFTKADVVTGEIVIAVLFRQGLLCGQLIYDGFQQAEITAALSCELEILFEAIGKNDLKHWTIPRS